MVMTVYIGIILHKSSSLLYHVPVAIALTKSLALDILSSF